MIFLSEEAIRPLLRWDALIDAMETALGDFSAGRSVQPVRSVLTIEPKLRYLGVMPAVAGSVMGVKVVSFYPKNAGTPVPTHLAIIVLFRTDTGEPIATLDGRLITEMRTAAVSAAVTRSLAPQGSRVLALLGSGVQAAAHREALASIYAFDDVRVWSRDPAHARRFASAHRARAMPTAEAAVRDADIVVTATSAAEPILNGAWLKPGAHVNAVGASQPAWRELDDAAMQAGFVIVDSRAAALVEAGELIHSKASVYAEAGEIFAGIVPRPPRGITVFKSLGLAVEDIAAAKLAYDASLQRRLPAS
jgi:thiomorpholine-carboxylate dehydrogenase